MIIKYIDFDKYKAFL